MRRSILSSIVQFDLFISEVCAFFFVCQCQDRKSSMNVMLVKNVFTLRKWLIRIIINGFFIKEFMRPQSTRLKASGTFSYFHREKNWTQLFRVAGRPRISWHWNHQELTSQFLFCRIELSDQCSCSPISHYSCSLELKTCCSGWRCGAT